MEVEMQKKGSLFIGVFLILVGILSLGGNMFMDFTERIPVSVFQLWPVIVIAVGLLFTMPPFFAPNNHGLGGLFIPGIPVLVTGGILFAASVMNNWGIWALAWPLEVIAVGIGFLLAAIFIRVIWLLIPATIITFTGGALAFTTLTGMWSTWSFLWTVIPLALGLAFIIIGLNEKKTTLTIVGAGFAGLAGVAFASLSVFETGWGFVNLLAPAFVILMGLFILTTGFVKREQVEGPSEEPLG